MGSAGRKHSHQVLRTARGLVGIQQYGPALVDDEIELAVVEAEFAPPLAHFVGNRDGLAADRFRCLDQSVWRDVAGTTFALAAKHPEPHRKAIRFSFGDELFHDEIAVPEDAIRDVAKR